MYVGGCKPAVRGYVFTLLIIREKSGPLIPTCHPTRAKVAGAEECPGTLATRFYRCEACGDRRRTPQSGTARYLCASTSQQHLLSSVRLLSLTDCMCSRRLFPSTLLLPLRNRPRPGSLHYPWLTYRPGRYNTFATMLQDPHHLSNGSPAANGGVKADEAAAPAATAAATATATVPSLRQVCLDLQDKVEAFLAEDVDTKILKNVQAQVKEAVGVIDEALERYRYVRSRPWPSNNLRKKQTTWTANIAWSHMILTIIHSIEELSLSYNGGKDCLVLLVLILACLPRHFEPTPPAADSSAAAAAASSIHNNGTIHSHAHSQPPPNTPLANTPRSTTPSPFPTTLQSVYIVSPHPFTEVDDFVETSTAQFHLDLCRYALPMREALEAYLQERPRLKAVFVGTRRTDPHGAKLTHFDETDEGWPAFVRVHPVIDWHYAEIWAVSL